MMRIWPGKPFPLGATWDGGGVNFALFSEHATGVELCLFRDPSDTKEFCRFRMSEQTDQVWHLYLPDARPGLLYGFRVDGPYAPEEGHRFNPNKILLDPYAKTVGRGVSWSDAMFGYTIGSSEEDLSFDTRDNAAEAPLAMVIESAFTWGDDQPPKTPWHKTVIYEVHVKGATQLHPEVPPELRGTYLGLSSQPMIEHLQGLGVTAVELLPVHHHLNDRLLIERGLSNYWGYNTLAFFAPDTRYAKGNHAREAVNEFKSMVHRLHSAGIEVLLDVVYNHSAEGNHLGPTLSLRGIDNQAYYRLVPDKLRYYFDYTGTGNSLNMMHPRVLQLIMDSLRYWVLEMHVDGFRFDLASTLARELFEVDKLGAFFDIIHQDPVLSQVKLIAEPWDLGEGGYQVGNFPVGWTEWNGQYRDTVRRFWKGDEERLSVLATRLCGSSDLYERSGRRPYASVNFVTCHDGFSLEDLVSYNQKHNHANGENNQDGADDNWSWNCGVEGPTDDPKVLALRKQQKRNLIATLLLSQGVPMLLAGDELSHTQKGNNNVYSQDNELSWLDWKLDERKRKFLNFVQRMVQLRYSQPVLQRRHFFQGRSIRGTEVKDVIWLRPDGQEMTDDEWEAGMRVLGMRLAGEAPDIISEHGESIVGDTLLILLNADDVDASFVLPAYEEHNKCWELLMETSQDSWPEEPTFVEGDKTVLTRARSISLYRRIQRSRLVGLALHHNGSSEPD